MCGIAGMVDPASIGARSELEHLAHTMADTISHRGPDDSGTWCDPDHGVALAHRRLSVVGLGAVGHQPMTSRSGRWVITYNGEIYNAPDLTRLLAAEGRVLRGTSDTEVLVECIDAWGVRTTLDRVNGMFAFGAWDREARSIVLARDRMGEKPLLYGWTGGRLAFASELRAIDALPGSTRALDRDAIALLMRFKYIPAPFSARVGVCKLLPGHLLVVGPDGGPDTEPEPYWSYDDMAEEAAGRQVVDEGEALEELDRLIASSVRRRLRSDVPIGAFLSGGIDSTLIASHAAEILEGPLRTFTIGSDDPDHDESSSAREVANRIGADHTELIVRSDDALAEVPTIASCYDEPFADSSQLPTLLVSRLAKRRVTVALSGDGGDELFGGYNRHVWLPQLWRRLERVPHGSRRALATMLAHPDPATWDRLGRLVPESRRPPLIGLKVEKLASVVGLAGPEQAFARLVSHWDEPQLVVRGSSAVATLTHRPDAWPELASVLARTMAVDATTYLPDDVLVKVDRASMHVGLEARVPFLDPEVVAFAARLPDSMRVRDGRGKWALRQLLLRRHPPAIVDRPKSGFGVPIAQWLRGPLRPWAEDLLSPAALAIDGLLDPAPVRKAWSDHLAGRRDASYELWDVLMLQSWRERDQGGMAG